ncbi:MAG: hypothetical protein ACQ9MH_14075 [Nitrospinales bacterium]
MKFFIIISTAVRSVFVNWKVLAIVLFFPIVLTIVVHVIKFKYFSSEGYLYHPIELAVDCVLLTFIAIPIHRFLLLGPESVSIWGFIKWTGREITFLISLMAIIYLLFLAVIFLGLLVTNLFGGDSLPLEMTFPLVPVCIWIFSRLAMIFPAIATDHAGNLKVSWELTKNNNICIFLVVLLFAILAFIPLYYFPKGFLQISIFQGLLFVLVKIIAIASLTIAYKMFVDEKTQPLPLTK